MIKQFVVQWTKVNQLNKHSKLQRKKVEILFDQYRQLYRQQASPEANDSPETKISVSSGWFLFFEVTDSFVFLERREPTR